MIYFARPLKGANGGLLGSMSHPTGHCWGQGYFVAIDRPAQRGFADHLAVLVVGSERQVLVLAHWEHRRFRAARLGHY